MLDGEKLGLSSSSRSCLRQMSVFSGLTRSLEIMGWFASVGRWSMFLQRLFAEELDRRQRENLTLFIAVPARYASTTDISIGEISGIIIKIKFVKEHLPLDLLKMRFTGSDVSDTSGCRML